METGSWQINDVNNPSQSVEEVLSIVQEARKSLNVPIVGGLLNGGTMDLDDLEADEEDLEDVETSGEFVCPLWVCVHEQAKLLFDVKMWIDFSVRAEIP